MRIFTINIIAFSLVTLATITAAWQVKTSLPWLDEEKDLLQSLQSVKQDHDAGAAVRSEKEDALAALQGIFNVIAQVEREKANSEMMNGKNSMAQFLGSVADSLWNIVKDLVKKTICNSREQRMRALLQERMTDEEVKDKENQALAMLQTIFNVLREANAKGTATEENDKMEAIQNVFSNTANKASFC